MADSSIITVMTVATVLTWLFISIYLNKIKPVYVSLIVVLFMAYGITKQQLEPNLISSYITDQTTGVSVSIIGIVEKIQEKESYTQIYLKENKITLSQKPEMNASSKGIILTVNEYSCDIGDTILATGKLKEFSTARNTGGFDAKTYYKTINIAYKCTGEVKEVIKKNENELLSILNHFKKRLKASYASIADEKDAGLYNSMILGDNEGMQEEITDLYKDNGITHLLAISGMQISMIGMLLYKLLRKAGIQFAPCAIVSLSVVICYGIITGNGVSTMRAVIMFVAVVGAGVCGRTYDVLSATSLAAILILAESPTMLLNCGFLLSFGAILGMVVVAPAMNHIIYTKEDMEKESVLKYLILSGLMSFSINLVTLPIILYFFFQLPVYSVLINMILIPLIAFVMISAGCGGLIGMVNMIAGVFCVGLAHYILAFYEAVCIWFLKLPYAIVIIGQPSIVQIVIYYGILIFIIAAIYHMKEAADQHKEKSIHRSVAFFLPLLLVILCFRHHDGLEISMIDVGQGDSIFVRTPQNTTYLFDCGSSDVKNVGKYRIVPFLKANGVSTLDYIVVSHLDTDHTNAISELLAENNCYDIRIKHIILPKIQERDQAYATLEEAIKNQGIPITYVSAGDEFGDGVVAMKCLHPKQNGSYATQNGYSTTVSLNYKDFDMLFTGDLEKDGEDELVNSNQLKDYDVLKVAHHGSMYSSQQKFLSIVKPEFALISCGIKNRFGHPHAELLERLNNIKSQTFITSECGEITLKTDGSKITLERFLKTKEP